MSLSKRNENNFLAAVKSESDRYLPILRQWAKRGVHRNPLDNSLLINYPPITAASKVTPENYAACKQALAGLRPDSSIALYIHIPFCSRRCSYCNYYSVSQDSVPDAYISLLKCELATYKKILGQKPVSIQSIYFGGGSPSLLTERQIEAVLGFINNSFEVQPQAEVSLEFHPEIIRKAGVNDYLKTVSVLGINRVSIGIQSLDDNVLQAINRGHSRREALDLLALLMQQGFPKVNVDIMYGGLPFQSINSMYDTLTGILAHKPTGISKHFCEIKPGSADFSRYKTNPAIYPDWAENIRLQTLIDMLILKHGYHKELLHMYTHIQPLFSHQKQKWNSKETILLGLGPGTYGWIFQPGIARNMVIYKTFSLEDYRRKLLEGSLPLERLAALDKDETARRHIQYALNYGCLDKAYLQSLLAGASDETSREINSTISALGKNEFLGETQHTYKITPLGEYLSDEIKALFSSQQVLNHKADDKIHAAHHWYPGLDLIKRFKNILLK